MRILFLVFLLAATPVFAETAYVTDLLRLGLHRAEDTSDRAFRMLESGQEMEILSRTRLYARVRLPDGTEGYVKAAYLVDEKPAKLIVAETRAETERVQQELDATRAALADPAATISELEAETARLRESLALANESITELEDDKQTLESRQSAYRNSLPLTWVAGAIAVCLFGGFFAGLWWVDHRSRKRHGGIRIY